MTCRDEIIDCIRQIIQQKGQNEFTIQEVVGYMQARNTRYRESTIRTHVASRMCSNTPEHHAVTYDDLDRIGYGVYRLRVTA
jgi:translation initiation factor RLI1